MENEVVETLVRRLANTSADSGALEGREAEGILVVRDAGEKLYRLVDGPVPAVG